MSRRSASAVRIRSLVAAIGLHAMCVGADAQVPTDRLEQELISSWLVVVEGDIRSRTFTVDEVARRSDRSLLLEASYGWTIGGNKAPVRADVVRPRGSTVLTIRTPARSVIVTKQTGPDSFEGTFTYPGGTRTTNVSITKASDERILLRVEEELRESRTGLGFQQENRDWGIAPTTSARPDRLQAPTPREAPGAKTLTTLELFHALSGSNPPVLIDVLDGPHATLSGANWMPGAGGVLGGAGMLRLAAALEKLTVGDKAKPMVFFCLNSECWLAFNATLRALELGYRNVAWYRGGTSAWGAANFPRKMTSKQSW